MPVGHNEVVITDQNFMQFINPVVGNEVKMHGLIPRNFQTHPQGYLACAPAFSLPIIPEGEWQARLDALVATKSLLSDIRNRGNYGQPIPSRDQNGKGYCWAHSGVSAHLVARARMNEPYVDLSAYAIACMIKGFRDEGGWGSEGVEFQATKGCPTSASWPQQSMARGNDNPNTWADAARHKYVVWMDLDPNNMKAQLVTCLLLGIPVVSDFNWWSHSVCAVDVVSLNPFQIRIWNSWGDKWSANGMGTLEGRKAIPDAGVAAIVVTPSMT